MRLRKILACLVLSFFMFEICESSTAFVRRRACNKKCVTHTVWTMSATPAADVNELAAQPRLAASRFLSRLIEDEATGPTGRLQAVPRRRFDRYAVPWFPLRLGASRQPASDEDLS